MQLDFRRLTCQFCRSAHGGRGAAPAPADVRSNHFFRIVTAAPRNRNKGGLWFRSVIQQRSTSNNAFIGSKILWLLGGLLVFSTTAPAQESGALIDALIRKGILTNQEAEEIRVELVRESNTIPARAMAGGKSTDRLSVGMRMQAQYAHLDNDVKGASSDPAVTNHAFLRRMYFTLKAGVGGNWGATMTYDFAGGSYDDAFIDWRPHNDLTFNFGLRKVNVGYEERASSGDLRSIERSGVTRYFVESNNGRRLGAASYRIGAFLDGKRALTANEKLQILYSAAITDPERNETFSLASSSGDGSNNKPAFWGNVGLTGRIGETGSWLAGAGVGHLPDQGGIGTASLGRGFGLTLYSVYTDITAGRFSLMAEFLTADVERGAAGGTSDAWPAGFFLQPTLRLSDTIEAVVRYEWLDTDGRGLQLSDVIRSGPAAPTMDKFESWYAGVNWYLRGNDLKWQLGVLSGESRDTLTGAPAEATTVGVRSQVQMQF